MFRSIIFVFAMVFGFTLSSWADPGYVPGEVIIKMKTQSSKGSKHQFIGKASLQHKMSLKRSWPKFDMHQFKLKPGQTVDEAINELSFDPDVEYVEPNFIFTKQSVGVQGEAMSFDEIRSLSHVEASSSNNFTQASSDVFDAAAAWEISSNSDYQPVVAVIDSGVDYNHYVFQATDAIWINEDEIPNNGIDDDGNGFIDDVRGWNFAAFTNDPMDDDNHGTHVAGIVLGMTQNIFVNEEELLPAKLKIMPLKFLDSNGVGSTSAAISAINYAVNNGATILNNSWGGSEFSKSLHDAMVTAYNSKVSFVAAAGNATNNNDTAPTYPASYSIPNVLSIAATEDSDNLAFFSNYGANTVHVGSPGHNILSTLPNDSFGISSGTSMAAPFVAGLAALLAVEESEISGFQMKEVIFEQSNAISGLSGKVASSGRINALDSIEYVQGNSLSSDQPNYSGSSGRSIASHSAAEGAGGCGLVQVLAKGGTSVGPGIGSGPLGTAGLVLGLLLMPIAFILGVRNQAKQKDGAARRAYERFEIDSKVTMNVGGREIIGNVSSISMGGAKVDTEELLENGGVLSMSISSPDGSQQIQVQGKVVWSEEKKAYGVQFCETKEKAIEGLRELTGKLAKSSN